MKKESRLADILEIFSRKARKKSMSGIVECSRCQILFDEDDEIEYDGQTLCPKCFEAQKNAL